MELVYYCWNNLLRCKTALGCSPLRGLPPRSRTASASGGGGRGERPAAEARLVVADVGPSLKRRATRWKGGKPPWDAAPLRGLPPRSRTASASGGGGRGERPAAEARLVVADVGPSLKRRATRWKGGKPPWDAAPLRGLPPRSRTASASGGRFLAVSWMPVVCDPVWPSKPCWHADDTGHRPAGSLKSPSRARHSARCLARKRRPFIKKERITL